MHLCIFASFATYLFLSYEPSANSIDQSGTCTSPAGESDACKPQKVNKQSNGGIATKLELNDGDHMPRLHSNRIATTSGQQLKEGLARRRPSVLVSVSCSKREGQKDMFTGDPDKAYTMNTIAARLPQGLSFGLRNAVSMKIYTGLL